MATDLLRWIPLIPLLGSVINLFFGRGSGQANWPAPLASAAVGASFALAFYLFWQLPATGIFRDLVYTWIQSGSFQVNLSFQVDALTAVMLLIVTGIGFLIHLYSLGYMGHDDGHGALFHLSQSVYLLHAVLVMADNSAPAVRRLGGRRSLFLSC